ncbi:hypothetical protein LTR62_001743 [Meristemomyces frigidus]|uniref:Uncharacterized protein n=1 Tax=Meristemomyces frigidus TaxID=1508187 RepID=A0AAN7TLI9_9PEZI|nr:hypothetical protein LTR62_001743 [Meristemomyces frigidus]
MAQMTAIKVRGKRSAKPQEKWTSGKKRRKNIAIGAPSFPTFAALVDSTALNRPDQRKRRRRHICLSTLEQLPTEILQDIFDYSANIELAFTSRTLWAQLRSQHVYMRLTTRILSRVLGYEDKERASSTDLAAATRLLGCKFMTWKLFRSWLEEQRPGVYRNTDQFLTAWSDLRPSMDLVPPIKLLRGPWTSERLSFLRIFSRAIENLLELSPPHYEVALSGFAEAVTEGSPNAVGMLLSMGLAPTTEMVRHAVIDSGCDKDIVIAILSHRNCEGHVGDVSTTNVDLLDPALWSWAEKVRRDGNEKGEWLTRLLRSKFAEIAAVPDAEL